MPPICTAMRRRSSLAFGTRRIGEEGADVSVEKDRLLRLKAKLI